MSKRNSFLISLLLAAGGSAMAQPANPPASMTEAWREISCAALAFMAADLHTYKTILFSGMPKTKAVVTHLAEGGKFSRAEVEANSEVSMMGLRHAGYSIDFIVGRYYEFGLFVKVG